MAVIAEARDQVMANAFSAGSILTEAFPSLKEAVYGDRHALRWYNAGFPKNLIPNWQSTPGDPNSGLLPRNYASDLLISVDKDTIDGYMNRKGGQQAVVYALGSAVMVGVDPMRTRIFAEHPDDEDRYAIGMGIGRGRLWAAMGVRTFEGVTLVPPDVAGRSMAHRTYAAEDAAAEILRV